MKIETKIHTVFMLIGATECGKTTFAKEILYPQLQLTDVAKGFKANVQYLSSDKIRGELLGNDYDKYDQVMLESSAQAFALLYEKLHLVTSFPINAEFVIVDTTGLSSDFREKIRDIARGNQYRVEVVLFDYKDRADYFTSERPRKLISNHLTRLRKEVMGSLAKEKYDQIHKIRKKDFLENPDYQVNILNKDAFLATLLPQDQDYIVIGDIHECVNELQGLLTQFDFDVKDGLVRQTEKSMNKKVILVGDWIDKGGDTNGIIEFLYRNKAHFLLVLGNHENFIYKYLRGEIKGVKQDLLENFFTSLVTLQEDVDLREKFNILVEGSLPFFRNIGLGGERKSFYVTHAPCKNKYLGKLDSNSLRKGRTFALDREQDVEQQISFIQAEAIGNQPFHFFGHVSAKDAFRVKNKVHLDSGCASGNKLTGVDISYRLFFKSQKAEQVENKEELPILFKRRKVVSLADLSSEQLKRLTYCIKNKINFISGTMSPADKDENTETLESLAKGLDYFKEKNVAEVILQPKYMGSRCNIYLYQERELCFAVSRNGYRFKGIEFDDVYRELLNKFGDYMRREKVAMMILDGEILPWRAAGEGLIEKQFKPIEVALETELSFLAATGFDDALDELVDAYGKTDFAKDQATQSKAALIEAYGTGNYQNFKYVKDILKARMPIESHIEAYGMYRKQLELYANDAPLQYKPFSILKLVYEDGEETFPTWAESEMYKFLTADSFLNVNLLEEDAYAKAMEFFTTLTVEKGMEGVVIKPEHPNEHTVPYLKVRNEDYLSIIYGYDYKFPHKYAKLIKQKNIRKKLRTSINEWRVSQQMLAIKHADISPDNEAYQAVVANMLFEVEKEKEIDPRL